jgi:3-keto-disaccharide hydrolase
MKCFRQPCVSGALAALSMACLISNAAAADLVYAKDGSGVYGYKDTPKLPWCPYLVHDPDRPAPPRVFPGPAPAPAPVPADAVVLFDGKDLSHWLPSTWKVQDGCIVAGLGELTSREQFGNCQIHVEWMDPAHFKGPWYNRGNNGVFLMGLYEIQIFDSWDEKIYPDGQAAAVYGQTPPLVNACRPPGQWQSYDIIFTAPLFQAGKLASPARVTMFHNGLLVHLNDVIHGETGHRILPHYNHQVSQGPLVLGGHGCPVRFRDIWVRPLR